MSIFSNELRYPSPHRDVSHLVASPASCSGRMETPPGILPLTMTILKSVVDYLALWKMSLRQFLQVLFLIKKNVFCKHNISQVSSEMSTTMWQALSPAHWPIRRPQQLYVTWLVRAHFRGRHLSSHLDLSRVYSDTSCPALLIKPTWMPNAGSQNKAGHSASSKDIIPSWAFIALPLWCIVVKVERKTTLGRSAYLVCHPTPCQSS